MSKGNIEGFSMGGRDACQGVPSRMVSIAQKLVESLYSEDRQIHRICVFVEDFLVTEWDVLKDKEGRIDTKRLYSDAIIAVLEEFPLDY